MGERVRLTAIVVLLAAGCAACDKVPLLAPTNSTITLSAPTRVLPLNGSTELTAFVSESSGTSVQNGTTVRFTTTLGRVEPVEAQTRNGSVTVTFLAGTSSGVAEIRALSGAAGGGSGGTGTGTATTAQNAVQITIGAAAVNAVTLRANPSTVSPAGGQVELVATVVAENGNALESIPVTFNSDQGSLSASNATTDSSGQARTTLTTAQKATVTATAGAKTSTAVVVDVRAAPGLSITCAPAAGTGNCAALQATGGNTATAIFTVTKGTGSSNFRDTTIEFGDGITQGLGTLAGGPVTVPHTYSGPSGVTPTSYTALVRGIDVNNEMTSASATVVIVPRAPLSVTVSGTAPSTNPTKVTLTATVKPDVGGADVTQRFTWDFGDGSSQETTSGNSTDHIYTAGAGIMTVTVTIQTTDGRTASGRTQVNIP